MDTLRVVDAYAGQEWYIKAKLVETLQLTPASERTAWNGTAEVYESKGKYYLNHHDGNSNHYAAAIKISRDYADLLISKKDDSSWLIEQKMNWL